MKKLKKWALAHKAISLLVVFALFSGVYGTVKAKSAVAGTQYILGSVRKGTLTTTVTGTGTVSAGNQIDVKAKSSGEIVSLRSAVGQYLSEGETIAELDGSAAALALRSSEINLEKVSQPGSDSKAYEDSQNDVASLFLDLPNVMDGLKSIFDINTGYLSGQNVNYVGDTAIAYQNTAGNEFVLARSKYDSFVLEYKSASRSSDTSAVSHLLATAYDTTKSISQALKDTKIAVDYVKNQQTTDPGGKGADAQSGLASWTSEINTHLQTLLSDETAIQGNKLDVESAQLDLQTKQNAYDDTFVKAPFGGVLAKLYVNQGDSISSGTVVATMISRDQIAEVSLNEVDAAKVKVGDKAKLTFDAVDGLTIDGTVSELDLVGTVSQGVVNYAAKITFSRTDDRVRPGMSVSASVITDAKADALFVPSSAVKTIGHASFVLVPATTTPSQVPVETGLINDTSTEIVSGLSEGEQIVVRTVATGTAKTATTAPSATSFLGGNRASAGGGATRALGR